MHCTYNVKIHEAYNVMQYYTWDIVFQINFKSWSTCIQNQGLSSPLPSHPCIDRQKLSVECLNNCMKKKNLVSSWTSECGWYKYSQRRNTHPIQKLITFFSNVSFWSLWLTLNLRLSSSWGVHQWQNNQKFRGLPCYTHIWLDHFHGQVPKQICYMILKRKIMKFWNSYQKRPQLSWNSTSLISWNEDGITLKPLFAS